MKKTGPSPTDEAVNTMLQTSYIASVFSLAYFYKSNPFNLITLRDKMNFLLRNVFVFSTVWGLNILITETYKKSSHNKTRSHWQERSMVALCSSLIPNFLGYKLYNFKNRGMPAEKIWFLSAGAIFFILDLNSLMNNKK